MTPTPPQTSGQQDVDTRERLLASGAELFAEKGFNGCGLAEVLRHAGVPKGSFYHWFGSKEEFGIALIERSRDEYMDLVRPVLSDRKTGPIQRLRKAFELGREHADSEASTDVCLVTRLALETGNLSQSVLAAVKCVHQQWNALIAQILREAQASGEIGPGEDPDRLAGVLLMLWEGATIRMQIERDARALDDFLDLVFDRLLGRN